MGLLDTLGSLAKNAFSKSTNDPKISELIKNVDGVIEEIDGLLSVKTGYESAFQQIITMISSGSLTYAQKESNDAVKIYKDQYLKGLDRNLVSAFEKPEHGFLGAVFNTLPVIKEDLELIIQHSKLLFGNFADGESLKVSHAYILGYIAYTQTLIKFAESMIYLNCVGTDKTRPIPYHLETVKKTVTPSVMFLNLIAKRGRKTIVQVLNDIKSKGGDVVLVSDDKTIADYGVATQYSHDDVIVAENGLSPSAFHPVMVVGDIIITLQRYRHERRKKTREWLSALIEHRSLQMSGMDQNSPDYKKLETAVNYYTREIANIDERIAEYEA